MTPEFAYSRLPDSAITDSPNFVKFIKDYYLWNQSEGINFVVNNYKDLIYQLAYSKEYEQRILKSFGVDIDIIESSPIHGELLYKLMTEFLETRGTKTSFEILFRIMFNEQVELKYSRDELFSPSSGVYQRTNSILISGNLPIDLETKIRGLRSNLSVNIESYVPYYMNGSRYYIVECNNIKDKFIIGEPLEITNSIGIFTEVHLPLINVEVLNPGILYKKGDIIKPSVNLLDGWFVVKSVKKGTVDNIDIIAGGVNYKVGDKIKVNISSHFDARISSVGINGEVISIEIKNKGYNFTDIPSHYIISENGTGLEIELKTLTIGRVSVIEPCNGGYIYENSFISYNAISENGTGLTLKSIAVDGYITSQYLYEKRFLGYKCKIINSDNAHSHSYDIISDVAGIKYEKAIDRYVNPTGFVYNKIYTKNNIATINDIGATGEIIRI